MNRMLILLGVLWAAALVVSSADRRFLSFAMMLAFGLHFAAKVLIAAESGRRFHQDRQSGAMELLLATPLRVEDIVAGQREALRKQFQRALWALALVNMLTVVSIFLILASAGGRMDGDEAFTFIEVAVGGAVMMWLDASALCWLGMWRGLKTKKYPRSVLASWSQVVVPPWAALLFFFIIGPVLMPTMEDTTMVFCILLWFGLGVAIDVASISWAREKLLKSMRSVVSEGCPG